MNTQFTLSQVEQIKKEIFNLPRAKEINLELNIDKIESLGEDYFYVFIEIISDYSKSINADEGTILSILDGSYIATDFYKNNLKTNTPSQSDRYYRTLDKNRFNKVFGENFESAVRSSFKEELKTLQQTCPKTGQIFMLTNFWAEHGANIGPGSIKGLANSKHTDLKKYKQAELRVHGKGSRAKPTIYSNINIDDNYLFLGTCHKKDNGNEGEEPYINKCLSLYKKFLELEKITEKNIINIENDF